MEERQMDLRSRKLFLGVATCPEDTSNSYMFLF